MTKDEIRLEKQKCYLKLLMLLMQEFEITKFTCRTTQILGFVGFDPSSVETEKGVEKTDFFYYKINHIFQQLFPVWLSDKFIYDCSVVFEISTIHSVPAIIITFEGNILCYSLP